MPSDSGEGGGGGMYSDSREGGGGGCVGCGGGVSIGATGLSDPARDAADLVRDEDFLGVRPDSSGSVLHWYDVGIPARRETFSS